MPPCECVAIMLPGCVVVGILPIAPGPASQDGLACMADVRASERLRSWMFARLYPPLTEHEPNAHILGRKDGPCALGLGVRRMAVDPHHATTMLPGLGELCRGAKR